LIIITGIGRLHYGAEKKEKQGQGIYLFLREDNTARASRKTEAERQIAANLRGLPIEANFSNASD